MTTRFPALPDDLAPADALLFGYAIGVLDEALSLLAQTYTAINDMAAENLREYQAIGGALLEDLAPVAMSAHCLDQLLARLEAEEEECRKVYERCGILPAPLRAYTGCDCEDLRWKHMRSGVDMVPVAKDRDARASLLRLDPGFAAPVHSHPGLEYTLILDGALIDRGELYRRGDLSVATPEIDHNPSSCPDHGCMALSVLYRPTAGGGWVATVVSKFLKG